MTKMFRVACFLATIARKLQKMVRMLFEQSLKKKEESPEEGSKQRCGHLQGVLQGKCKSPSGFYFSCSGSDQVHNCGVGMEFEIFFFQKAGSVLNGHVGQRTLTFQEPRNHGITQVPIRVQCEMVVLGDCHCRKTGFPNSRSAEGQLFKEKTVNTSHGCPSTAMATAITRHTLIPGPPPTVRRRATSPITISRPISSSPSNVERPVASTILRFEFLLQS